MPIARAAAALLLVAALAAPSAHAAEGRMTWGVHVSLTPAFFDPADATGTALPLMVYYAVHDALVRPLPGQAMGAGLARSWTASRDGLVYEFVLRPGVRFHNGDPVTPEDVKFSFERYRGASAAVLKSKVAAVEVAGPDRVRFRLKQPWPDFMTFYATPATGAAWIVPKKYVEQVGDEGMKRAPVGAGPYKFVSFKPGVELVLEAHEGYWRKAPVVKTLVFKVIPDDVDPARRAQAGRDRHRVRAHRSPRRGGAAHGRPSAQVGEDPGDALARLRRPARPEVALARPPRAPGREPGRGQEGDQRGGLPRPRHHLVVLHPPLDGVLLGAAAPPARPGAGARSPGPGGLPQRVRRRRPHQRAVRGRRHRRAGRERPGRHRHPPPPAPAGARRLPQAVRRQDAAST